MAKDESGSVPGGVTRLVSSLREIWIEVLDVDKVASEDNFFDLGGDSLQAEVLILLTRERLGVHIAMEDIIFQNLAQLAVTCAKRAFEDPGRY